jgi:hypothetical protein
VLRSKDPEGVAQEMWALFAGPHLRDRGGRGHAGGWTATKLFHVVTLHGFFNLSTWLTAIAGSAVLLLAYHLLTPAAPPRQPRSSAAIPPTDGPRSPHRRRPTRAELSPAPGGAGRSKRHLDPNGPW